MWRIDRIDIHGAVGDLVFVDEFRVAHAGGEKIDSVVRTSRVSVYYGCYFMCIVDSTIHR